MRISASTEQIWWPKSICSNCLIQPTQEGLQILLAKKKLLPKNKDIIKAEFEQGGAESSAYRHVQLYAFN
jgi:hypothetical protein